MKQNYSKLVKLSFNWSNHLFYFLNRATQTCSLHFTNSRSIYFENHVRRTNPRKSTEQVLHRTEESHTKSRTRKILTKHTRVRADTVLSLSNKKVVLSPVSVFTCYHAASFARCFVTSLQVLVRADFRESRPRQAVSQWRRRATSRRFRSWLNRSRTLAARRPFLEWQICLWLFPLFLPSLRQREGHTRRRGDERVLRAPRSFCSNGFLMRHQYTTDLSTHVNRFTRGNA